MATEPRIIKFYETTLRDGEQTPGVNYFPEEKLAIAQALADMGFDTLDCGFPVSCPSEFDAVRVAARPVIEPFISVSPLHRKVKLGKTREEVLEMARVAVAHGRTLTEN